MQQGPRTPKNLERVRTGSSVILMHGQGISTPGSAKDVSMVHFGSGSKYYFSGVFRERYMAYGEAGSQASVVLVWLPRLVA